MCLEACGVEEQTEYGRKIPQTDIMRKLFEEIKDMVACISNRVTYITRPNTAKR